MMNVYWLRGKIGDAVWLWMALNTVIQQPPNLENEWFPVLEGKPVGDGQLGQTLFADEETVSTWRNRLESLGLIRTTLLPDKDGLGLPCRTYEVVNLNFGAPKAEPPLGSIRVN
jgi:hypothetical protein